MSAVAMIICPHCHAEIETSGPFCIECGSRLYPEDDEIEADSPENADRAALHLDSPESIAAPAVSSEFASSRVAATQSAPASTAQSPVRRQLMESRAASVASNLTALSTEDWMLVLTALGHYAGTLRELNMSAERENLLRVYELISRSIRAD